MYEYAIEIFYSEDDEGYIAVVPELAGCSSFGDTEAGALREAMAAIALWLQTAKMRVERSHDPEEESYYKRFLMKKSFFTPPAHKRSSHNNVTAYHP